MFADVTCPRCHQPPGWPCETVSGAECGPHSARIKVSLAKEKEKVMPCRSDYMEPTERERESVRVCKHLQHLSRVLKHPLPGDVRKGVQTMYGNVSLLDAHTALLCELMNEYENEIATRISEMFKPEDMELMIWFRRHKEADKKREERERKAEREQALAKRKHDLKVLDSLIRKYPENAKDLIRGQGQ